MSTAVQGTSAARFGLTFLCNETPIVAVDTFGICFTHGNLLIGFENVLDNGIDSVVSNAQVPSLVAHRVIDTSLSRETLTLKGIPRSSTGGEIAIACTHENRICCIPNVESSSTRWNR